MIIEKSRAEFFETLNTGDTFNSDSWLAICLLIPPEWLHEAPITDSRRQQVIDLGQKVLSVLERGYSARIGWCSYFAISDETTVLAKTKLDHGLLTLRAEEEYCQLWRYSIAEIHGRNALEVFSSIEWQTHEISRQEGKGSEARQIIVEV